MATKKKKAASIPKKKAPSKAVKKAPFKNHVTQLKTGDKAPAFSGVDQNGQNLSNKDFIGKKLVVYFYPEDDTPTCTKQACNLRDNYGLLQKKGIEIIGVSEDSVSKHKKFETKHQLPFRLIADEKHTVIDAFDVWGKKQFMGKIYDGIIRTTFLINEKGLIDHIINRPDTADHASEILESWNMK
ncbi:MAG TPA: thioredoxin-dependent thiol peroxidase [Lacibacter sp.]|nr:thioredoxin-dependent thiol peroxidase [Lacibacter sp.]